MHIDNPHATTTNNKILFDLELELFWSNTKTQLIDCYTDNLFIRDESIVDCPYNAPIYCRVNLGAQYAYGDIEYHTVIVMSCGNWRYVRKWTIDHKMYLCLQKTLYPYMIDRFFMLGRSCKIPWQHNALFNDPGCFDTEYQIGEI